MAKRKIRNEDQKDPDYNPMKETPKKKKKITPAKSGLGNNIRNIASKLVKKVLPTGTARNLFNSARRKPKCSLDNPRTDIIRPENFSQAESEGPSTSQCITNTEGNQIDPAVPSVSTVDNHHNDILLQFSGSQCLSVGSQNTLSDDISEDEISFTGSSRVNSPELSRSVMKNRRYREQHLNQIRESDAKRKRIERELSIASTPRSSHSYRQTRYREQNREANSMRRKTATEARRAEMMRNTELDEPHCIPSIARTVAKTHSLGSRNNICPFCDAIHFAGAMVCCANGKVFVPPYKKMPEPLFSLFFDYGNPDKNHFQLHVLMYNALFQFASIQYDRAKALDYCAPLVKVNGLVRQFPSAALPNNPSRQRFGNLFVMDSDAALAERLGRDSMKVLKTEIVTAIHSLMLEHPFAKMYRTLFERMEEDKQNGLDPEYLRVKIVSPYDYNREQLQGHQSLYVQESATPNREYVLVFFDATVDRTVLPPGLIIYPKLGRRTPRPIHYWRPEVDTLSYPLLFPFGEPGYDRRALPLVTPQVFEERIKEFIIGKNPDDYDSDSEYPIPNQENSVCDAVDRNSIVSSDEINSPTMVQNVLRETSSGTEFEPASEDEYDEAFDLQLATLGEESVVQPVHFEERGGELYPVHGTGQYVNIDSADDDDSGSELNIEDVEEDAATLPNSFPLDDGPDADNSDSQGVTEIEDDDLIREQDDSSGDEEQIPSDGEESENDDRRKRSQKKRMYTSRRQYLCYINQDRHRFRNRLRGGGKLAQLNIIDGYLRIQQNEMKFIQDKYTEFSTSTKKKVIKAFERIAEKRGRRIGAVTTVPSRVPGAPRYLLRRFENAVAISNVLGKPDLFITFTCNNEWTEIKENLKPGETWTNRQKLVNEVFHKKKDALLEDVVGKAVRKGCKKGARKDGIFGQVLWFTYSIEFQRSGLPHMHLLVSLKNKIRTTAQVDGVCQAVLPKIVIDDPDSAKLRKLVERFHVHTPCEGNSGAYCNEGRKPHWSTCRKRFPKEFRNTTEMGDRNYPELRRPQDGETCKKKCMMAVDGRKKKAVVEADNRHVVPYNVFLLSKYEAHCNVEGFDRALIECFENIDAGGASLDNEMTVSGHVMHPKRLRLPAGVIEERNHEAVDNLAKRGIPTRDDAGNPVLTFNECQIVMDMGSTTSMEAFYHIEGRPRTGCSHEVVTTFIHPPDEEIMRIDFDKEAEALEKAQNDEVNSQIKAWFELNSRDDDDGEKARKMTFEEIPRHFAYKNGKWVFRKRTRAHFTIGKVKNVNPRYMTAFAIRLLCLHQRGPRSFEELRTVNGHVHESFVEAARALRLMNSEDEWDAALKEASQDQMPRALRRMFITILLYCAPSNPRKLFDDNKEIFFENKPSWSEEMKLAHALYHIRSGLKAHGVDMENFELPEPNEADLPDRMELDDDNSVNEHTRQLYEDIGNRMLAGLTNSQRVVAERIIESVQTGERKSFFLDAPGGCGKTYIYKAVYYVLKGLSKNVLCVAHSGVAAGLLPHGMTVHRAFSLPLQLEENTTSNVELESTERRGSAEFLSKIDVVLWDEACMSDRRIYEAVDKLFHRLHEDEGHDEMFGGTTFVMGGDWRQTLPIVNEVSGEGVVNYTLKKSHFWTGLEKLKLTENLRAIEDPDFARFALSVGNGQLPTDEDGNIVLPEEIVMNNERDLIQHVFGSGKLEDDHYVKDACILTVDNRTSLELNETILKMKNGANMTYTSRDEHDPEHGFTSTLPEIYNGLTPSGLPPHKLNLKLGATVILLRNLAVNLGLANGLRMKIVKMGLDTIHCEPLSGGSRVPQNIILHRMAMRPSNVDCRDIAFTRWQFPIRLAYSMTINKSQGQTLGNVGVLFRSPVFSHGQLYVAISRVRSFKFLRIVNKTNKENRLLLRNVVYQSVLDKLPGTAPSTDVPMPNAMPSRHNPNRIICGSDPSLRTTVNSSNRNSVGAANEVASTAGHFNRTFASSLLHAISYLTVKDLILQSSCDDAVMVAMKRFMVRPDVQLANGILQNLNYCNTVNLAPNGETEIPELFLNLLDFIPLDISKHFGFDQKTAMVCTICRHKDEPTFTPMEMLHRVVRKRETKISVLLNSTDICDKTDIMCNSCNKTTLHIRRQCILVSRLTKYLIVQVKFEDGSIVEEDQVFDNIEILGQRWKLRAFILFLKHNVLGGTYMAYGRNPHSGEWFRYHNGDLAKTSKPKYSDARQSLRTLMFEKFTDDLRDGDILLENPTSTFCFANAVIQSLRSLPIRDKIRGLADDSAQLRGLRFLMTACGRQSVEHLLQSCSHEHDFLDGQQHDANELFCFIMERLPEEIARPYSLEFVQKFTCRVAGCKHETVARTTSVMVTTPYQKIGARPSISQLVDATRSRQMLSKVCSACGDSTEDNHDVEDYYELTQATQFLTVLVQRFAPNDFQQMVPSQLILDDCSHRTSQMLGSAWHLRATISHSGITSQQGHYYSFVRRGSEWIKCNDTSITTVEKPEFDTVSVLIFEKV